MYVMAERGKVSGSQPTLGYSSRTIDPSGGSSRHRQLYRSFETRGIDPEFDFNSVSLELPMMEMIVLIEIKVVNKKK